MMAMNQQGTLALYMQEYTETEACLDRHASFDRNLHAAHMASYKLSKERNREKDLQFA